MSDFKHYLVNDDLIKFIAKYAGYEFPELANRPRFVAIDVTNDKPIVTIEATEE